MEDLERINQKLREVLDDLQSWATKRVGDTLEDAYDPALLQSFLKGAGFDTSALSSLMGKQPGLDAYAVLGLSQDCSDEELRSRYRRIMAKIHPDRGGQEMTFLASLVNKAYQALCKERGIS